MFLWLRSLSRVFQFALKNKVRTNIFIFAQVSKVDLCFRVISCLGLRLQVIKPWLCIFYIFVEHMSICTAIDSPVLDFWWMFPLGFNARVDSIIFTWWRCMYYTFPQIHLLCDTCQPLGNQHSCQADVFTYLWPGIGGTRMGDFSLYRRTLHLLSYAGSAGY